MSKLLVSILFIALVFFGVSAATDISSCGNYSSGSYTLAANLSGASNLVDSLGDNIYTCINFNSSNVYLNCQLNRFTSDGANAASAIGVVPESFATVTNITITNCVISGYNRGIVTFLTNDTHFSNIYVDTVNSSTTSFDSFGIYVNVGSNLSFNNIVVENTTHTDDGDYRGLAFENAHNVVVSNSSFLNLTKGISINYDHETGLGASNNLNISGSNFTNLSFGVFIQNSSYVNMTNNRFNVMNDTGILINRSNFDFVSNNNFSFNNISANISYSNFTTISLNSMFNNTQGVYVDGANDTVLNLNNITNATGTIACGICANGGLGNDERTNVTNNNFSYISSNKRAAIYLGASSYIYNNDVFNISSIGIQTLSDISSILYNRLTNSSGYDCIYTGAGSNNITGNNVSICNIGIYAGESDNTVENNRVTNTIESGIYIGSTSSNVTGNFVNNSSNAFLITENNTQLSYNNASFARDSGFNISATVNLTNNLAFNNSQYGIFLNGSNYSIVSGNVLNYNRDGIGLDTTTNNNLSFNNISYSTYNGLYILDSLYGVFSNFVIFNTSNTSSPIWVRGTSAFNNFTSNILHGGDSPGMYIDDFGSNVISNSVMYNNSAGGIHIYSNSNVLNNNSISNNSVSISDELFGIYIYGANNTNLSNNTISSSAIGLNLRSANNTTIVSDRYFNNSNNSILFNASLTNSNMSVNLTSVVLDSPSGALSGYSNISLFDVVVNSSIYSLNWSSSPGSSPSGLTSPSNQYLSIGNSTELVSLDSLTFHYVSGDVNDESTLSLWRYSSGSWTEVNATLNTASDLVNVSALSSFGTFALFEEESSSDSSSSSSSSSSSDSRPSWSVTHNSGCPNIVRVSRGGSATADVFVSIIQNDETIISGRTDSNGRFNYSASGNSVYVRLGSSTFFGPYELSSCSLETFNESVNSTPVILPTVPVNESTSPDMSPETELPVEPETESPMVQDSPPTTPVSNTVVTPSPPTTSSTSQTGATPETTGSGSSASASSGNSGGFAFVGILIVLFVVVGAGAYWFLVLRR